MTLVVFNHSPPHILIQDLGLELTGWLIELVSSLQESLFWDYRQEIRTRSSFTWVLRIENLVFMLP